MIISHPNAKKSEGKSCETVAELIDLYPTLADLCGYKDKKPSILQGKSFAPFVLENQKLKGESVAYTISYGGRGGTIRTDKWRYTRWGEDATGSNEELYDHENDPEEHLNLADNPKVSKVLIEMRAKFDAARNKARNQ